MARLLSRAKADADKELKNLEITGIGSIVRDAQIRTTLAAISRALGELFRAMGLLVEAGREEAAALALEASFDWDEILLKQVYKDKDRREAMRKSLLETGRYNVEAAVQRNTNQRDTLSTRVYRSQALAQGWVEKTISSSITRGESPAKLAQSVRSFIDPRTPGGATYAARRLARTEINNAYHAITIVHNEKKPWNLGIGWHLSGSHKGSDKCDEYAKLDRHGLGRGIFPTTEVPRKPHPQCMCFVAPETVSIEEFIQSLALGEYDEWMREQYGS